MPYRKEVHYECIKLIRKFMIPFSYDIPGYNREFVDPFNKDKKRFARLVKDCCTVAAASVDIASRILLDTFTNTDNIIESKRAVKKVNFLLSVRNQLYRIGVKDPNAIFKYCDKYGEIEKEDPEHSFLVYN